MTKRQPYSLDKVEFGIAHSLERLVAQNTSIVDEDIDTSPLLQSLVYDLLAIRD